MSISRAHLLAIVVAASTACGEIAAEAPIGPACEALLEAARRASECDPALDSLARRVEDERNEASCRLAARMLVAGGASDRPPVLHSVFEPATPDDDSPLTADELRALADLPLPARLEVAPDLRPAPGVPPTNADVEGVTLRVDADGSLRGDVAPGARTLRLRHAGREALYCLELRACEPTRVIAHGARLAKHAHVKPGPC